MGQLGSDPASRRGRSGGRLRRLIAVVVILDLVGGGALAYALTRPSTAHHTPAGPTTPLTVLAASEPATTVTVTTASRTSIKPGRRGHEPMPAATKMTSPSMSRAPKLPARARSGLPLAGKRVGVDPGHNGRNGTDPAFIDHQIWNGREYEDCNTTGTETDAGYTEAQFNWNVGRYLVTDLRREGATVVLTRHSNDGVGPCVNRRAQIFNQAHVSVGVAIHADGGPPDGRGFAILEPVPDGINNAAINGSYRFARVLRSRFLTMTGMPESTYDGTDALQPRDDLAGENLTQVPYALIECGNMRNATDAALLTSPSWQRRAAQAIAAAITVFVAAR